MYICNTCFLSIISLNTESTKRRKSNTYCVANPYAVNLKAKDVGNLTPIITTSSSWCVDTITDGDVSNPNLILDDGHTWMICDLRMLRSLHLRTMLHRDIADSPLHVNIFRLSFTCYNLQLHPISIIVCTLIPVRNIQQRSSFIELCFNASICVIQLRSEYQFNQLKVRKALPWITVEKRDCKVVRSQRVISLFFILISF